MLGWEIWARHRLWFIGIGAALPIACVIAHWHGPFAPGGRHDDLVSFLLGMTMAFSIIATCGLFNYTHLDRKTGQTGFPNRLFTLPVSTREMVGWPMLFALVATLALYVAWSHLVFRAMDVAIPIAWPACVLAAGVAWYLVVLWALPAYRTVQILVLSVGGTVLVGIALLPMVDRDHFHYRAAATVMLLLVPAAYATALYAVHRQRHSGGHGAGARAIVDRVADVVMPIRTKPFRSAAAAQVWIEWRKTGLLLPACTLLVMGMIFLGGAAFGPVSAERVMLTLPFILATPLVLAIGIGGLTTAPALTAVDGSLAPFVFARPMTPGGYVSAKVKMTALSAAAAWAVVVAITPLWLLFCDRSSLADLVREVIAPLSRAQLWIIVPLLPLVPWAVTWRALVVRVHLGLAGRPRREAAATAFAFLAPLVFLVTALNLAESQYGPLIFGLILWALPAIGWLLVALLIAKMTFAARLTEDAIEARHVVARDAYGYWITWAVISVLLAVTVYLLLGRGHWLPLYEMPAESYLAAILALLLLPINRLAQAPHALARNRHR
jgi:hypothetical protein